MGARPAEPTWANPSRRRAGALGSWSLSSFTVAVGLIGLLLVPSGLGLSPAVRTVTKAPFTGSAISSVSVNTNGCGASAVVAKLPVFNLTTGRLGAAGRSSVAGCGASTFAPFASTAMRAGLDGSSFTVTGGSHAVWVNWSLAWTTNLSAMAGNASQSASSFASVGVFAFLYDSTNGSTLPASNSFSSSLGTASGAVNRHWFANVSFVIRAMLATGHTYVVVSIVQITETTILSVGGTGTAAGRISLSGPGNHARLRAITLV